jgi:hypothetical protein
MLRFVLFVVYPPFYFRSQVSTVIKLVPNFPALRLVFGKGNSAIETFPR